MKVPLYVQIGLGTFFVCLLPIGRVLRRRVNAQIDETLRMHREYMRKLEEENPEYRGTQWGKP